MSFCQVWIARRATRSNLTKPQTFPLEKPRSSNTGLRCSLVFWMSLYKDYEYFAQGTQFVDFFYPRECGNADEPANLILHITGHSFTMAERVHMEHLLSLKKPM